MAVRAVTRARRGRRYVAAAGAMVVLGCAWALAVRASSHDLSIVDYAFQPTDLTVLAGEPVTWTNQAGRNHTVTSDSGSELDSGDIGPGEAYGHVFETAGTYRYHDAGFPEAMRGTITVLTAPATPIPSGSREPTPPAGTLPPNFSPFPSEGSAPSPTVASTPAPTGSSSPSGGDDAISGLPIAIAAGLLVLGGGLALVLARRRRP